MTKEEKDELIALSDLNREDNIKYISSEAQGIAIALDSDKYAPTFCKLERAYICGRRKSEKENAELKNTIYTHEYYQNGYKQGKLEESRKREVEIFEVQGEVELRDVRIYDLNKKVAELEKENAKLREKLNFSTQYYQGEKAKVQLAKAKEIIRALLFHLTKDTFAVIYETQIEQAEQFLKEIENGK